MKEASKVHVKRAFKSLGRAELQTGADDDLLLLSDLFKTDDELILGFYTEQGLRIALDRYGMYELIADRGFIDVEVHAGPHSNGYQLSVESDRAEKLVHVVFDRAILDLSKIVTGDGVVSPEVVYVHWVMLQNPRQPFTKNRPPLPGQQHPGLGFGRRVLELLGNVARRLGLQGLVAVPMEFHNAFFYDVGFEFADPMYQGLFEAMVRDGVEFYKSYYGFPKTMAVCAASWAFEYGLVTTPEGEKVDWFTEPMVSPLSHALHDYLGSDWFRMEVEKATELNRYKFPGEALFERLDRAGIRPLDLEKLSSKP